MSFVGGGRVAQICNSEIRTEVFGGRVRHWRGNYSVDVVLIEAGISDCIQRGLQHELKFSLVCSTCEGGLSDAGYARPVFE